MVFLDITFLGGLILSLQSTMKTPTLITNSNRNDKLSGYQVLHMKIDDQVYSKSVDKWIALEPVLLYQAVMGKIWCCVTLPLFQFYRPSLQQPALKKLEQAVKKIRPGLVLGKEIRKARRREKGLLAKAARNSKK